ncbi:MAG: NusG domain II-containing protein [Firmicutes bacterium]|nr:NusG domain II-containing protein [Bacillota bacterium]
MIDESKIDRIKKSRPFSLFDIIAISLALALCIGVLIFSCATRVEGETLIIIQAAEGITKRYSLLEDQEITLHVAEGDLIVVIKDGAAYVKFSPCRGKDCMRMPAIRHAGRSITCADQRVFIIVEGQSNFTVIS